MSQDTGSHFHRQPPSDSGGEGPLIPLLDPEEGATDPVVLATWHEVLAGALAVEIPHDLFALWLYPADGGVVLLGPAALADDHLDVPLPRPHVPQDRLWQLEEVVRHAGYRSAISLPVRFGGGDVGLLLLADLQPNRYGPRQAVFLQQVAHRLGPTMARLARQWTAGGGPGDTAPRTAIDAVVGGLVTTLESTRTPRDFAHGVFGALRYAIPHDRAELLIPGASAEQWYRMGEHPAGPLWADPELVVALEEIDVAALFGTADRLLVPDTRHDPRWAGWPTAMGPIRSAVGVRLGVAGRPVGYLILGSGGPGLYREADLELLARIGTLVAPRVENFVLGWHLQVLRTQLGTLRSVPAHLSRISDLLAATADTTEAMRRFAVEAAVVLPSDRVRFALVVPDERRVVLVAPSDVAALAELPAAAVEGTALGQVVEGELPGVLVTRDLEAIVVVPLRVAGRVFGAMELTTMGAASYGRSDLALAQQLADAVAPHLDAVRRAGESAAPPEHPADHPYGHSRMP